jgi:hypothetical protein
MIKNGHKTRMIQVPSNAGWSAGVYWFRLRGPSTKKVVQTKVLLK